jgi:hypothetical protein
LWPKWDAFGAGAFFPTAACAGVPTVSTAIAARAATTPNAFVDLALIVGSLGIDPFGGRRYGEQMNVP